MTATTTVSTKPAMIVPGSEFNSFSIPLSSLVPSGLKAARESYAREQPAANARFAMAVCNIRLWW